MKRCVFILPWFGPLRNYFDLFLRTCSNNNEYDWLLITDQEVRDEPKNVRVLPMRFEEFAGLVQSKFDFKIALNKPYKICDFRPAFGYIFEEEIAGYEYWGHCDCDLLFGRLAPILEPLFDAAYDKIFGAGHMTIYANAPENNRRFMRKDGEGISMCRIACSHEGVFAFDEATYSRNIHTLFLGQGAKVYGRDLAFNVSTSYYGLRRVTLNPVSLKWEIEKEKPRAVWLDESGIAAQYKLAGSDAIRHYAYIHLQGREMQMVKPNELGERIQILPDRFVNVGAPETGSKIPSGLTTHCSRSKALVQTLRRTKRRIFNYDDAPHSFDPYAPYL